MSTLIHWHFVLVNFPSHLLTIQLDFAGGALPSRPVLTWKTTPLRTWRVVAQGLHGDAHAVDAEAREEAVLHPEAPALRHLLYEMPMLEFGMAGYLKLQGQELHRRQDARNRNQSHCASCCRSGGSPIRNKCRRSAKPLAATTTWAVPGNAEPTPLPWPRIEP